MTWGDIAAVEWYVKTGGTEKDFFINGNRIYIKQPNGEIQLVYDEEPAAPAQLKQSLPKLEKLLPLSLTQNSNLCLVCSNYNDHQT